MAKRIFITCLLLIYFIPGSRAQNNYKEVTLVELMQKKKAGDPKMIIVDVSSRGEYGDSSRGKSGNIGRIKGAINIPLQELQKDPEMIHQFDAFRDKDIYLICSHSYRSRTVSSLLLKNGFTSVNNTRGGMTEWYRRYDELLPYRSELEDGDILYKNLSPSELLGSLRSGETPLLIGIRNKPRFFYDSGNVTFYKYYPLLKQAKYFEYADSIQLFEYVQKEKRPVVLFNMVNSGAGELAEWMTKKGVPNAKYLVGGINLLYEYALNKLGKDETEKYFTTDSGIDFLTPALYCKSLLNGSKKLQVIDLRADSLFNRVNKGVKHSYSHFKGSINFPVTGSIDEFEKALSKNAGTYLFFNEFGSKGIELADALAKKGYSIAWMIGGYDGWEWYMNNIEDFPCQDLLQE